MNLKEIHGYLITKDITEYAIQMDCRLVADSFEIDQFKYLGLNK